MQASSRVPTSAQTGVHEDLGRLLDRHCARAFRKPYADYNVAAFSASMASYAARGGGAPLILDAGCGVGESSIALARAFPDHYVIGVDQSASRLARNIAGKRELPDNLDLVRADLVDYWRLLRAADIRLSRHYLLYPNPWPKIGQRRYFLNARTTIATLLGLGGGLECRGNWRIYVEEFCFAVERLAQQPVLCEAYEPEIEAALTPFERKYLASGHRVYRAGVTL